MKRYGAPRTVITDRLRSYGAAMKEIGNSDRQEVGRHLNNREQKTVTCPSEATRARDVAVQANVEPTEVRGTVATDVAA